jgi:fluoride ion exporter CrcB/FEX
MDPQRQAAIRQALLRLPISYAPLLGGLVWALFASRNWAGPRGDFLAVSGVMIGLAASSALSLPFLRVVTEGRKVMRMSLTRYTYVSISIAIGIAVVLVGAAVLVPPE